MIHLHLFLPLPLFNASMIKGRQPLPFFLSQQLLTQLCGETKQGCWLFSCSVHQVSKGVGHTLGKGLSVTLGD